MPMDNGRQLYIDELSNQFKGTITISKGVQENEIYVCARKENLIEICLYLQNTHRAILSTMVCNDERSIDKYFKIYYVFSMPRADIFIIVSVPISEQQPEFPSITSKIPAAHWYEREIKDMFGL